MSQRSLQRNFVRQFIDDEARVDENEISDDDMDPIDENFINDSSDEESGEPSGSAGPSTNYVRWEDVNEGNEGWEKLLNHWKRLGSRQSRGSPHQENSESRHSSESRQITEEDYPLWRIRCRKGIEEEALLFIAQMTKEDHEIRSAFTLGPSIRGYIYVEGKMDKPVTDLLKRSPGLFHKYPDVERNPIDFTDYHALLTMTDSTIPEDNSWVKITKGTYKGDIGFSTGFEPWGGVSVLLIPRLELPSTQLQSTSSGKRKRTSRSLPALFNPHLATLSFGSKKPPTLRKDGYYHFLGHRYQHGLIINEYDFSSVTPAYRIQTAVLSLFMQSGHPKLTNFPCPTEWVFTEGETVLVFTHGNLGTIISIGDLFAEVNLIRDGGLIKAPWYNIQKFFSIGDLVEVVHGSHKDKSGLITGIQRGRLDIITNNEETLQGVHANTVRLAPTPLILKGQDEDQRQKVPSGGRVPWVGELVINNNVQHEMKGRKAVVKDVICGHDTESGLKVTIQYTDFIPSRPNHTETIDYDHVIHADRLLKLFDFERPKGPNWKIFEPKNHNRLSTLVLPPRPLPTVQYPLPSIATTSTGTPLPNFSPMHTPAWNPSSQTPLHPSSQPSSLPPPSQHDLLNPLLLGKKMKAIWTGGKKSLQEIIVYLVETSGNLSIHRTLRNQSIYIPPETITPKNPDYARDNGLLVVIKGEHTGKYVRRIFHRFDDLMKPVVMLAVVEGIDNGPQVLSPEQFDLPAAHLCVCDEPKPQRDVGDKIMKDLRNRASKQR